MAKKKTTIQVQYRCVRDQSLCTEAISGTESEPVTCQGCAAALIFNVPALQIVSTKATESCPKPGEHLLLTIKEMGLAE
jgi:hypothetical protein